MPDATTVDGYIRDAAQWRDELLELRKILNSAGLEETVKLGGPCYTRRGKNVAPAVERGYATAAAASGNRMFSAATVLAIRFAK